LTFKEYKLKKIIFGSLTLAVFVVFLSAAGAFANRLWVMDTPTAKLLDYGSYNVGIRIFDSGSLQSRLDFGVFKILNVGLAWEFDNFIGNQQVKVAVPALSAKVNIYGGDMNIPAIAIGYDGQGYFYDAFHDGKFAQDAKGVYLVAGREVLLPGLIVSGGLNTNDFDTGKIFAFLSAIAPVYEDIISLMAEYDNLHSFSDARFNAGVRFNVMENLDLDFMMRDCWGPNNPGRVPNERIFKVSYSGKF